MKNDKRQVLDLKTGSFYNMREDKNKWKGSNIS